MSLQDLRLACFGRVFFWLSKSIVTIFVRNMAVTQAMFDRLLRWNCSTVASPFQGRNLQKVSCFFFLIFLSIFPSVHSLGSWVLKEVQVRVRQGSFSPGFQESGRFWDRSGRLRRLWGLGRWEGICRFCYEAREVLKGTRWGYHPSLFWYQKTCWYANAQRSWSFEEASFPLQGHRRCQPFHQLPRGRGSETELKGALWIFFFISRWTFSIWICESYGKPKLWIRLWTVMGRCSPHPWRPWASIWL